MGREKWDQLFRAGAMAWVNMQSAALCTGLKACRELREGVSGTRWGEDHKHTVEPGHGGK